MSGRAILGGQQQQDSHVDADEEWEADAAGDQAIARQTSLGIIRQQFGRGKQAGPQLPDDMKQRLREQAQRRLFHAGESFCDAAMAHQVRLATAAKSSPPLLLELVEMALGYALPGVVGGAIDALIVELASSYGVVDAHVSQIIDRRDKLVGIATAQGKQAVMQGLTGSPPASDHAAVLEHLRMSMRLGIGIVCDQLHAMTPDMLFAVAAAYHESVANEAVFRVAIGELLSRYQEQVAEIGTKPGGRWDFTGAYTECVFWVDYLGHSYLAKGSKGDYLLKNPFVPSSVPYIMDSWVDPQLEELAIAKQLSVRSIGEVAAGQQIPHISYREVKNFIPPQADPRIRAFKPELRERTQ